MGTTCMHGVVPLQVSEGALGRHTPHGTPPRSMTCVAVLTGDSSAQLRSMAISLWTGFRGQCLEL